MRHILLIQEISSAFKIQGIHRPALLPHSQHCRDHQAAEAQQQTQGPGQIVTPLKSQSEPPPFQPASDVLSAEKPAASTWKTCVFSPIFLIVLLRFLIVPDHCCFIPSRDHISLDCTLFICVFVLHFGSGWQQQVSILQHKKEDQIGIKNIVRIQRAIDAGGVTWCFFPQASCLHCWRLTQEGWGSDVLSVTERTSVERENSEKRGEETDNDLSNLSPSSWAPTQQHTLKQMDEQHYIGEYILYVFLSHFK